MTRSMKRLMFSCLSFVLLSVGLSACSFLERRMQAENANDASPYYANTNEKRLNEAREELGLRGKSLSGVDYDRLETRMYLKDLESRLTNRAEKAQYYQIKSSLKTDQDRIQFLTLSSSESKARWIKSRGLNMDDRHSNEIANIIEKQDIALGMSQSAVRESWGDPDAIEVAGDSVYGYERWRYNRFISGNDGYQKEMRMVFFEGGRVVGWQTN